MFLIAVIDHVLVPSTLSYVGYTDGDDRHMRLTTFRTSAEIYDNKRTAIREAKRLAKTFVNREVKVISYGRHLIWTSKPDLYAY